MNTPVQPVRRDLQFDFNFDNILQWQPTRNMTHLLNTLSVFFPKGEQFFIDSVRHYRSKGEITDPVLLENVRQFIGQEAMHGREHREYNSALEKHGVGAAKQEEIVDGLLKFLTRITPPSHRLSATCALEHLTATLADGLLQNPEILEGADKTYVAAWVWHALEETEHKGVAYDVYQTTVGDDSSLKAYFIRIEGHVLANLIFWPMALGFWVRQSKRAGDLGNLKDWGTTFNKLLGKKPGLLRRQFPMWLSYFKRGFHPWEHDNREFLVQIDAITDQYS